MYCLAPNRQPMAEQLFSLSYERYFADCMGMPERAASILDRFVGGGEGEGGATDQPAFEQIYAPPM